MAEPSEVRKIAVTGPPCSGKSTALTGFAEGFHSPVSVAEEQARIFFDGVPVEQRLRLDAQLELLELIKAEETRAAEAGWPVLCDRSVVDGIAYLRIAGRMDEADKLFEHVRFWLPTYERFVLCSPDGIPYVQDSVRTEPPEFRDELHRHLIETFEDYGIEYDLLTGDRQQRHDRIAEIVRQPQASEG